MALTIAFIPLNPNAQWSSEKIQKYLAKYWPDLPKPESEDTPDNSQIVFSLGKSHVIIAHMPAPIPWSDLEGPCATSWLWPDAEKELKPHTDHLIVTIMSGEDPISQSARLTQVCASILATCRQAIGVYWGNATLVIPSKLFQEFAAEVLPEGPPLHIWVDFRVVKVGKNRCNGFTTGMSALGHMEFETEDATDAPGELRERFIALAGYVLEKGPVIKDGHTVGGDEHEKIRVKYAKSSFGHKGNVMRLEYEAQSKKLKK